MACCASYALLLCLNQGMFASKIRVEYEQDGDSQALTLIDPEQAEMVALLVKSRCYAN